MSSHFIRKDSNFCLTLCNIPAPHPSRFPENLKHLRKDFHELGHGHGSVVPWLVRCHRAISQLLLSVSTPGLSFIQSLKTCIWNHSPPICYYLNDNTFSKSGIITVRLLPLLHMKRIYFLFLKITIHY